MTNENELLQKLMISKKIMEKHNTMPRNSIDGAGYESRQAFNSPKLEEFDLPTTSYNIPQEFLQENIPAKIPKYVNSQEKIMSSKLPDEIKRLMIEHPINQPDNMSGPTLSNELVEKAARLMNVNSEKKIEEVNYTKKDFKDNDDNFKQILKEVVKEVLNENGMLLESTSKTDDIFSFKVGKHVFEGKLLKIKKLK